MSFSFQIWFSQILKVIKHFSGQAHKAREKSGCLATGLGVLSITVMDGVIFKGLPNLVCPDYQMSYYSAYFFETLGGEASFFFFILPIGSYFLN